MTINKTFEKPRVGSVWTHRNGNTYRVLMYTNTATKAPDERYPVTIVYQNVNNSTMWSRRLDDWYRSMTFAHLYE